MWGRARARTPTTAYWGTITGSSAPRCYGYKTPQIIKNLTELAATTSPHNHHLSSLHPCDHPCEPLKSREEVVGGSTSSSRGHNILGGTSGNTCCLMSRLFTAKNLIINTYFFFRLFLVHEEGVGRCFLTRRWQRRSILTTPSLWYKLCHQQWLPWFQYFATGIPHWQMKRIYLR